MGGPLRFTLAACAFLVAFPTTAPAAPAGNPILSIEAVEDASFTRIRVRCAKKPTFTVFRLEDPVRLFVDIAGGDIGAVKNTLAVENGVVDRVGTLQFRRKGKTMGRVIIGLSRSAAYDVRREDNVIVVLIDATGRQPRAQRNPEAIEARRAEVEKGRRALATLKKRIAREEARLDDLREDGEGRSVFMLRLTLSHPDIHTIIAGTKNPEHLRENVDAATRGPLPPETYSEAMRRLSEAGVVAAPDG